MRYVVEETENAEDRQQFIFPNNLTLHKYQEEAIQRWADNGYHGVFDMATGTGKTLTSISACHRLYEECQEKLGIIILCPYRHLVDQWLEDLRWFSINPIVGYSGAGYGDFARQLETKIINYNRREKDFFVFICTIDTFMRDDIQHYIAQVKENLALVADEAHYMGAQNAKTYLTDRYDYRLALSATIERHWDETGTKALYRFFGRKVFTYSLEQAIAEHKLCKYYYYPIITYLTDEESLKYLKLSIELKKYVIHTDTGTELQEAGKMILIQRARIVAGGMEKLSRLDDIVCTHEQDDNMLFYCGTTNVNEELNELDTKECRQVDYVCSMLKKKHGMNVARFTSDENMKQRAELIDQVKKKELQGLVAIKCLDEGVNIPSVKTAFILASTTNPKEYIQRRGRVLRTDEGKEYAAIYDFVTMPFRESSVGQNALTGTGYDLSLVRKELVRMKEFTRLSINKDVNQKLITELEENYHINEEVDEDELWNE